MATAPKKYAAAWLDYQRRSLRFFVFLFVYPLVAVPLGALLHYVTGFEQWFSVVCIPWMVILTWLSSDVSGFRCPRCGGAFIASRFFHNGFTTRCVHCKLPKWSENDPDEQIL